MPVPKLTKKQLDEIVTIKCYWTEEKMKRRDAIDFYFDAAVNCEGAERDRYFNVYCDLIYGEMYCCDE